MSSDPDIYRAAKLIIDQHGDGAELLNLPNRRPEKALRSVALVAGERYTRYRPTIAIAC